MTKFDSTPNVIILIILISIKKIFKTYKIFNDDVHAVYDGINAEYHDLVERFLLHRIDLLQ